MNLEMVGEDVVKTIKGLNSFPFKTGNLKDHATKGNLIQPDIYDIKFDSSVAPYIPYLEEGTKEHDIPFAFIGKYSSNGKTNWKYWYPYGDGIPFIFGMGGRFNGKFHPGSSKHKGFISEKCVNAVIMYFCFKYKGELR